MSINGQLRERETLEKESEETDGLENLRQFMAILRSWDREDMMKSREFRGHAFARRCFTDDNESD